MKKLLLILLAVLMLCGCGNGSTATEPTVTDPTTSEKAAPDFTMYTLDGQKVKLSEFKGKPTILNFWASWCGPCKSEMPDLEEAYKTYGDRLNFVLVNLTDGKSETLEDASSFIQTMGYTFPVFYDMDLDGATAYGVNSIPLTIFINASGEMVAYYTGAMSKEVLQTGINLLLPATE